MISLVEADENDYIKVAFDSWVDNRIGNLDNFSELYNRCINDESYKDSVQMYRKLLYLNRKKRVEIDNEGTFYGGVYIGADLKDSAYKLGSNEDLQSTKRAILQLFEEMLEKDKSIK